MQLLCFLQPLGIQPRKRRDDEEQPLIGTDTSICDNAELVVQGIMNILHCHNINVIEIIPRSHIINLRVRYEEIYQKQFGHNNMMYVFITCFSRIQVFLDEPSITLKRGQSTVLYYFFNSVI